MTNIQITGRHVEVTPPIHDYVVDKFDKIERHFDHITKVHVILEVEKQEHKAEATVHAAGHADLFAKASDKNMYAAIDLLVDKLDRQIIKHKEKIERV